jgi:hypothetical protein
MEDKPNRRRRGGSLVFPALLIILGVLFLLDNLNITNGIDWGTVFKLWPLILVAFGLEIILGRRASFGAILLVLVVLVVGGAALWWSAAADTDDARPESFAWSSAGVERAEVVLDMGVGELRVSGAGDLGDLLEADLELARGVNLDQSVSVTSGVATGRIATDQDFFAWPRVFSGRSTRWNLTLNERVRWQLDVDLGLGDAELDLSSLRVAEFDLNSGVGSVEVTLPRGSVRVKIDGGVGNLRVNIPSEAQVRLRIDRGISDLNLSDRFRRQGDYYETEGFDSAESFIDLDIDMGIGDVTIR